MAGLNTTIEEALAARAAALEEAAWGEDIDGGEARAPTEDELAEIAAELLAEVQKLAEGSDRLPAGGMRLAAGIGRLADRLGVEVEEVEAALAGEEGMGAAWNVLLAVLSAAADQDWLMEPVGRGGEPLTAAEAGLERGSRTADDTVIRTDGRDGKGLGAHWWSRKGRT